MAITGKNQTNYVFLAVMGIVLTVMIMPHKVAGQTLNSPVNQTRLFGPALPQLKVGRYPFSIAVNPDKNKVYVANFYSDTFSVIYVNTMQTTTIHVGIEPKSIAVDPDRNKVYVANFRSNTISVTNADKNEVVASIPVGHGPSSIAVEPYRNIIYLANDESNTVSVLNGNNDSRMAPDIPVGRLPISIAAILNSGVYVANGGSVTVSVMTGLTIGGPGIGALGVFKNLTVGEFPHSIAEM
jgi:YVTN family beta-propeller protein